MSLDWTYITKDRAQDNMKALAIEAIRNLANDSESSAEVFNAKIRGILMLMDAFNGSLEDDRDDR